MVSAVVTKGKKLSPEQRANKSFRGVYNDAVKFVRIDAGGKNPHAIQTARFRKWLLDVKSEGKQLTSDLVGEYAVSLLKGQNESIKKRLGIGCDGAMADLNRRIRRAEKLLAKYKLAHRRFEEVMAEPGEAIIKNKLNYALREMRTVLTELTSIVNGV